MKKKNLKSLKLNKKSISSLNLTKTNGGGINISEVIGCVTANANCGPHSGSECESWGSVEYCECTL